MQGEVHSVEVAVQKESLVDVEREALYEISETGYFFLFWDLSELVGDAFGDGLIGFCAERGSNGAEHGEDPGYLHVYFSRKDPELAAAE